MARKNKRDSKKIDIQFLRQRDGYASTKHDWQNQTGQSFRKLIKGQVAFPEQRKPDISE
jgi:hypothetical protein